MAVQVRVVADAVPVLAAALGRRPLGELRTLRGMVLISGTGSLAWGCRGVDDHGELVEGRVGGWGYLLGDEGSGYWLAVEGLRAACRAADGIGRPTELLPAMLAALQLQTPSELVGAVYAQPLDRQRLAQLAPVVLSLASTPSQLGDAVATGIVEQAAEDLSQMVGCLRNKLQLGDGPIPLALTGGVLLQGTPLRDRLIESLQSQELDIQLVPTPVLGSVYLAAATLQAART